MKTGWKTTEFWLGLVSVVLAYLNQSQGWNIPVAEIIAVAGVVISYIASRTVLKLNQQSPSL